MIPLPEDDFHSAHSYRGVPFTRALTPRPTVLDCLADHVRDHSDDPAFTTVAADGGHVTLSFGELDMRSRRMARWLRRDLGLDVGDTVAFAPVNDITSIVTIFALLRSGCPALLVGPADPPARVRQQTDALGVKTILRPPAAVSSDGLVVPDAMTLTDDCPAEPGPAIDPMADALYFGTSGSTAASKLVSQSHYNGAVNAYGVGRHHGLRRGDRLLGCLPIHHVNGLHFTVLGAVAAGAHVVLAHAFEPFGYARLIEEFRPRIASVVPSILEVLHEVWRRPTPPSGLDYFVSAAAPLTTRTANAVVQKIGARVLQGYGLTETTNFSTTMPPDTSDDLYQRLMLDAEIPSIGSAVYGNEVAVLTADGHRAAPGEIGEICMRGHNVMTCYAANEQATAEAFTKGWFHSKDLGYEIVDAESRRSFFVITGRSKNIAKVQGVAVSLDEMDRLLRSLPGVMDAASVAIPHRFLGEEIVAAVVYSPTATLVEVDVRRHLRTVFAEALLPARIVSLDVIPRTPTGKVLRPQLAERLAT